MYRDRTQRRSAKLLLDVIRSGGGWRRGSAGFTLVELMITVSIVGILAAVAIPLMQQNAERARASECVAHLGTLRSAMRAYYAEHGTFNAGHFDSSSVVTVPGVLMVNEDDLGGRYFSAECYTFARRPDATAFRIECNGAESTAPAAEEVESIVRYIDEDGNITGN